MKNNSQIFMILEYMKVEGYITSQIAFHRMGATRLAAIIHKLRKMGYLIETQMCVGKSRFGNTCSYAKYIYLGKEEEDEQSNQNDAGQC